MVYTIIPWYTLSYYDGMKNDKECWGNIIVSQYISTDLEDHMFELYWHIFFIFQQLVS